MACRNLARASRCEAQRHVLQECFSVDDATSLFEMAAGVTSRQHMKGRGRSVETHLDLQLGRLLQPGILTRQRHRWATGLDRDLWAADQAAHLAVKWHLDAHSHGPLNLI